MRIMYVCSYAISCVQESEQRCVITDQATRKLLILAIFGIVHRERPTMAFRKMKSAALVGTMDVSMILS